MAEPMQPITNPVLVDAMATFKLDLANRENEELFKEHEKAFLQAAIEAKYLLPAQIEQPAEPPKEGEQVQTRVAFQIMTNPKGEKFMPAFTDEVELKKNRQPGERFQVAVMGFMELYQFMKANEAINGVVINPFGSALCLIRQQVIAIGDQGGKPVLSAPAQTAQPQPQQIQLIPPPQPTNALGAVENSREQQQDLIRAAMAQLDADKEAAANSTAEPEKDPLTDDLLGALKGVLKKQKNVKKAYIKPDIENGERYLLVALDADENADIEAIGNTLTTECADYSDLPFDCVPSGSIRAKELVAEGKPFYEKKRFGIF